MTTRTNRWQERYLDRFYRKRKNWANGTQQFQELIRKHLSKDKHILELGPGPENRTSVFLCGKFASVDGLDVDEDARKNPALRHVHIYDGGSWPIGDESYYRERYKDNGCGGNPLEKPSIGRFYMLSPHRSR